MSSVEKCPVTENLEQSIYSLRRKNYQSRYFVPRKPLLDLLHPANIGSALFGIVPRHQLAEIQSAVYPDGRLLFAILVSIGQLGLIPRFIEHDQLQCGQLDQKLPFDETALSVIIGLGHATRFCEKQWEFIAPVFSAFTIARYLADEITLPYIRETPFGQGSFGQVYEVEIDDDHHMFHEVSRKIVRKDITQKRFPNDWQAELKSLATIGLIRHPNIVKLLGFYIHREVPSFLFPKAENGTLQDLLDSPRPKIFQDNSSLLAAMAGLVSAVAAVHNFTATEVNLELIGCHHDVRPANILVDQRQFILTDFGLANLKDPSEGSSTAYKVRKGFNIAPECQDLDGNFATHRVSRPSDIWSLGCIILNLLTYMHDGPDGISTFDDKRAFGIGHFEYALFHQGREPHPVVAEWIEYLKTKSDVAECMVLDITKEMLLHKPEQRPVAKKVEQTLFRAAITAQCQSTSSKFDSLRDTDAITGLSTDLLVQHTRFQSWIAVTGYGYLHIGHSDGATIFAQDIHSFSLFQSISSLLANLNQQITANLRAPSTTCEGTLLPVRLTITALYELITPQSRQKAQRLSEAFLSRTNNSRVEKETALEDEAVDVSDLHSPPRTSISPQGAELEAFVTCSDYEVNEPLGLSEKIEAAIEHEEHAINLPHRGEIHHVPEDAPLDVPHSVSRTVVDNGLPCRPMSLHQILSLATGSHEDLDANMLPSMNRRFQLAYDVASSLRQLHDEGHTYEGLSSDQIRFLPPDKSFQDPSSPMWTHKPYLVGIPLNDPAKRSSREGSGEVTDPLSREGQHALSSPYQHPQYRERNIRYRLAYDCYSLGVILLEIGFWKPISQLASREGLDAEGTRVHLLSRRLPWLKHLMGETYHAVVSVCLSQELGNDDGEDAGIQEQQQRELQVSFEAKVVSPLSRLASLSV